MWQYQVVQLSNGTLHGSVRFQPNWVVAQFDAFPPSPNPYARAMLSDSLLALRQEALIAQGRIMQVYAAAH